jgi:hypothetical protein
MMPPKIAVLDADGAPVEDLGLGASNEQIWRAEAAGPSIVVRSRQRMPAAEQPHTVHRLRRCATDSMKGVTYVEQTIPMAPRGEAIFPETRPAAIWAVGAEGLVYVSSAYEEYRIQVFASDGTQLPPIVRPYDHVAHSEQAFREARENRKEIERHIGLYVEPSRYHRDIQAILPRSDGSLWVQSSQGRADPERGVFGLYDVFDANRSYVKQVRVMVPFNPEVDESFVVEDRLFVVEHGRDARRARYAAGRGEEAEDKAAAATPRLRIICYELPGSRRMLPSF